MLRNAKAGTAFGGDGTRGRIDLGGMLGWPQGDNDVFRSVLAHPRLIPYVREGVSVSVRESTQCARRVCEIVTKHPTAI